MRNGGQLLVESVPTPGAAGSFGVPGESAVLDARSNAVSKTGAVLDPDISPEALTPRRTLSHMRDAALASLKAKA